MISPRATIKKTKKKQWRKTLKKILYLTRKYPLRKEGNKREIGGRRKQQHGWEIQKTKSKMADKIQSYQ